MPNSIGDPSNAVIVDLAELEKGKGSTGECRIVFCSARLDNRQELVALLSAGSSISDPDLILAAYQRFGTDCADHLIGDFAFAICDWGKGHVFAARDFMGCQPAYYSSDGQRLVIAETLDQVIAVDSVSRAPDEPFIAASLTYAFAHDERTHFEAVRKIPPAHWLKIDQSGTSSHIYWSPEDVARRTWTDHAKCLTEFRELYQLAVRDRLPETGATGVHVSGGLDCSSVAVVAAQELKAAGAREPVALTWYPPPGADLPEVEQEEYGRVLAACEAAGLEPVYTEPTRDSVLETLQRDHMVRPICNASYNEALVLKEAQARGVTTILSGFGGDEGASFNGRGYFQRLALTGRWLTLRRFAKAQGIGTFRFCFGFLFIGLSHSFLPERHLRATKGTSYGNDVPGWRLAISALMEIFRIFVPAGQKKTAANPDMHPYIDADFLQRVEPLPRFPPARYVGVKSAQYQLLKLSSLVARIESWAADGARHGIKYAYPLLDRRLIEFVLSLPDHVFRNGEWDRLFFREAMAPFLPANICKQRTKSDPARANPAIKALKAAFIEIGNALRSESTQSSKAKYLDMPRLIEDLAAERIQDRDRMGRLVIAMEFFGTGANGQKAETKRND